MLCLTRVHDADEGDVAVRVGHVEPRALRPLGQGTRSGSGTVADAALLGTRQLRPERPGSTFSRDLSSRYNPGPRILSQKGDVSS